jgi:PHS family inorganic phosphate transporter-like MFS transporter
VTIIILACFKPALEGRSEYNQLDAVWRIQMGLGLVPAFATLWARLTMPEGKKFTQSKELNTKSSSSSTKSASTITPPDSARIPALEKVDHHLVAQYDHTSPPTSLQFAKGDTETSKYSTFFIYFKQWRHLKTLLGTTSCWFFLDIAFYGTNLNQSVLLTEIGFSTGKNEYDVLFRNALGNLIIAAAGYVPGYFFTIYFVEKLGRRWIQIQGFLVCALMFGILAGDYGNLGTAPKFVCFAIAQVNLPTSHSRNKDTDIHP